MVALAMTQMLHQELPPIQAVIQVTIMEVIKPINSLRITTNKQVYKTSRQVVLLGVSLVGHSELARLHLIPAEMKLGQKTFIAITSLNIRRS